MFWILHLTNVYRSTGSGMTRQLSRQTLSTLKKSATTPQCHQATIRQMWFTALGSIRRRICSVGWYYCEFFALHFEWYCGLWFYRTTSFCYVSVTCIGTPYSHSSWLVFFFLVLLVVFFFEVVFFLGSVFLVVMWHLLKSLYLFVYWKILVF